MNLLFLNVGRRCELVEAFRRALVLRGGGTIFASDITPLAPGLQVADRSVIFPHGDSLEFADTLLSFCRSNEIDLVIPTIDPDLLRLDALVERFAFELPSCRLLISSSFTLRHARDKRRSRRLFAELGADVPTEVSLDDPDFSFPVFVKPFDGSGGQGAEIVHDRASLLNHLEENSDLMLENVVLGSEYTVDVLCDFQSKALCAIPRRRIKVRSGEVVQGVVERNLELETLASKLAEGFRATGPVTVQFLKPNDGCFVAMEINARMGGGLPLTIAAGADWPGCIIDMYEGRVPSLGTNIVDNLLMTRCDKSFFLTKHDLSVLSGQQQTPLKDTIEIKKKVNETKGFIFDMDDTLFCERDFVFSGYRAVASKVYTDHSVDIEGELRALFLRGGRGDLFSLALNSFDVPFDESYVKGLVDIYRSHRPNIRPFLDVIPTLDFLKKRGVKIGLVSDGWLSVQQRKLMSLGIDRFFDSIVFTDSINGVKSWKPAVDGFNECLKELKLEPSESIYIGDNPQKDFIGAKSLGMNTIRVHRRGIEHEFVRSVSLVHDAHVDFTSFQQILDLFCHE